MEIITDIPGMRVFVARERAAGKRIVFVPTMGALHEGHGACVSAGRRIDGSALVVSIFVNPTQFAAGEDLDRYPRPFETDLSQCREWDVDAVFAPSAVAMYPSPQRTWVTVEEVTEPMCGRSRRGHFRGVATVVAKLFNIVHPDVAIFGQKDAQQALVIRAMVEQLDIPVAIQLVPIVRERDGLAMSSRNRNLDPGDRSLAPGIYRALRRGLDMVREGARDPSSLEREVKKALAEGGIRDIDYVEIRRARDLSALERLEGGVILAAAARLGSTRLIDNVVFRVDDDGSVAEEMLF